MLLLACGQLSFSQQMQFFKPDTVFVHEVNGDSTGYTLSLGGIVDTVAYGDTLHFSFSLIPLRPNDGRAYGFHTHGYGNYNDGSEMPAYSFLTEGGCCGAAFYNFEFNMRNSERLLPGRHEGYIPIHVYRLDNEGTKVLKFYVDLTVTP